MPAGPLTLGTAGHIDHGKTALIEALTGVNTDRLPQERERGISIELGFARLTLPSGRDLGVVDVPGHERFVRTMVAGATGIDLFLLVVAADDGVMPQTREHLDVMRVLGVPAGVVAMTKVDTVGEEELAPAMQELRSFMQATGYAHAPVVPVSARQRIGLEELRSALDDVAAGLAPRAEQAGAPVCLHVDRCFTMRGAGTVVTGTLWTGNAREGQEVRIEPAGRRARVRAVHVHDERVAAAGAGRRVALNLAGVERDEVRRGDVIVTGEGRLPTYFVDAIVELLPGNRLLDAGARVHVHHGTRDTPARVQPLESHEPSPGTPALAQLRLEQPIVAAAGDRFVLRRVAPPGTLGGGRVLEPHAGKHGPGETHVRRLRALDSGDPLEALRLELESARSGVGAAPGEELLEQLTRAGYAAAAGRTQRRWFMPGILDRARRDVLRALAQGDAGTGALSRTTGLEAQALAAVLEDLVAEGAVRERNGLFGAAAGPRAVDDPLARRLAELVDADGVVPRAPDALAAAAGVERARVVRALDALAADGVVVRLRPGVYIGREALESARRAVVAACERDGSITIARLRDALGTSRKLAQAILEHLDAGRITRRRGDEHVMRSRAN